MDMSRVRVGAWVVTEDRDRAYEGSSEAENPLQERTQIAVPGRSEDSRLCSLSNKQLDSRAIFQFGISRAF